MASPSGSLSDNLTDLAKLVLYCLFFFYDKSEKIFKFGGFVFIVNCPSLFIGCSLYASF